MLQLEPGRNHYDFLFDGKVGCSLSASKNIMKQLPPCSLQIKLGLGCGVHTIRSKLVERSTYRISWGDIYPPLSLKQTEVGSPLPKRVAYRSVGSPDAHTVGNLQPVAAWRC